MVSKLWIKGEAHLNRQRGGLVGTDFRRHGSERGFHPHQAVTVELSSKSRQEKQQLNLEQST